MSGESSSKGEKDIGWMYEGTRSIVNREDYLLGKKIDRNFELFSDVVVKDREEERRDEFFRKSLLHSSSSVPQQPKVVSALDTRVVRTEDPLVALKFQEEQRKRQMLDNPLLKMKAQRVLRKAFEKELNKEKKRHHKQSRSSSSSSSSSPSRKKRSSKHKKTKDNGHKQRRNGRRDDSTRRSRSRSRDSSGKNSYRESNARRHRSNDESSFSKERIDRKKHEIETEFGTGSLSARKTGETSITAITTLQVSSSMKKKLTPEELEKKRKAMMENASWRDEMRERNLRGAAEKLRKEQEELEDAPRGAGFMRPLMRAATAGSSIEQRLQSNRMNIQRQHDHMDKSFTRK